MSLTRAGYTVVHQNTAVSLAHEYDVTTPWQRFEGGVARRTGFGRETIVVDRFRAEEFLTVDERQGPKVWRWSLRAPNLVPRLTTEGTIEFLAGKKPAALGIPAVAIFDATGNDITPVGLRWSLARHANAWRLELRLDDSDLPLPYVIDPTITFQSRSDAANQNAAFLEINKPAGVAAGDFLIAQITVRGGTGTTITPPSGWTFVRRDDNGTTLAQAIYYKVAGASEPAKYRWDFGPGANVQRAAGGIIRYTGVDTANPIDNSSGNTGNGTALTALTVTTTAPNDMLVGFFGLSKSGGTLTEPASMDFRYEAVSGGGGGADAQARALAADELQASPGPSGNRTATASNNAAAPWVAQLIALRPAGVPATLTLAPATATNAAGQQHCVTATVRDSAGNPSVGYTVRFSVTGANSASGMATTNASGQAQFCYTGTNVGPDTITAFADTNNNGAQDAGEPSGTATKVYTPAAPATLVLSPPAAQNPAATQHCVTATVRDAFGNPVPGVTVRFSVTGFNTASGSATTDASGQAQFCYTGTQAGLDAITAYADTNNNGVQDLVPPEPFGTAVKTYVPGAPASVVLEPAADTNSAGEEHCVTATVRDIAGNPVPNVSVVFSVTGANPQSAAARTTNASGQATFCYTGTAVGPDTINAFVDTNGSGTHDPLLGEPAGTAAKIYTAAAPATLVLAPQQDTNTAGEEHCVTATVKDRFGNPNPGVVVQFSVSGPNSQPGVATTDANGEATFCYTGTKAGTDTITAFADTNVNGTQDDGEPSDTATKTYEPAAPATVMVEPPTDTNRAGEEHCVTATVTDAFGNPTPGIKVDFAVTGANSASGSDTTDANGQAEFCYTGTVAGVDTITATADSDKDGTVENGEPTGAATKTYRPGKPATVTVAPPTDTNRAGEEHCVTATVRDEFGNPVEAGIKVSFTVTGANPQPATLTSTDANGQAKFCYTGTKAGLDTITATADGDEDGTVETGEPTGTATKTYTPADPARITLAPKEDTNTAGEQHCVTATVEDRFGNRTPGVIVRFSVTGANSASGAVPTDANGQAQFCYTGTKAGTDTINAFADTNANTTQDNGEPGDTATKIYEPGPPAKVTVAPPTDTNKAGEEHCVTATVTDKFDNPTPGIAVAFTVTGANTASGSGTTDAAGQAKFCYTGTKAGLDTITATADGDEDGTVETGEPTGTATKTYTPADPASLVLEPEQDTNTAGEQHCVTATVEDRFGNRTPGVIVRFSVTGANSASGAATTDANGQASFCYTGTKAGTDTISAFADTNANTTQDNGEPGDTATKIYEPGPPAKVTVAPATATNKAGEQHCVTATVTDAFDNPTQGIAVAFTVTGANTASGSGTTDAAGQAKFCYTGTKAGLDTITATADGDEDGTVETGEPTGTATKTYTPADPATLVLDPKAATNPVDTEHCVTATVKDQFGNPTPRVTVVFSVTGSVSTSGSDKTNKDGQARFCYDGPPLPGEDLIRAFADTNGNGTQDAGEPGDTATKTWVLPVSTPGCEVKITNGGWFHTLLNGDRASFGGNASVSATGEVRGQEEYQDHGPATPMNVHSINVLAVVCTELPLQASIYGTATIDGSGSFFFRIQVTDNGEPGTSDVYGMLLSNGYFSGDQTLEGGNVQIHL